MATHMTRKEINDVMLCVVALALAGAIVVAVFYGVL